MAQPQLEGRWDDLVVICAATPWAGTKFQDRHLAERLSRMMPVLYVDPPLSRLTPRDKPWLADSIRRPRLRLMAPSLAQLTVVGPPFPERAGVFLVTNWLYRRELRHAIAALRASVRAIVYSCSTMSSVGACGERLKIYWAQDDQVGGAGMTGFSPRRVARVEAARVREADIIVASSPSVADSWRAEGLDPVLIPFGCDDAAFGTTDAAQLPADVRLSLPIAGFVGGLVADRIDIRLLQAVADQGHSLLLVGPKHNRQGLDGFQQLLQRPNVQWVGPKPFRELPSYLRMVDVGLVPYSDTAFNRGSFPLKTLEYLAAGKPVVSTDLPATRWLGTDLVSIRSNPDSFAAAVADSFAGARDPDRIAERQAFARRHSWDERAREFAELILKGSA